MIGSPGIGYQAGDEKTKEQFDLYHDLEDELEEVQARIEELEERTDVGDQ